MGSFFRRCGFRGFGPDPAGPGGSSRDEGPGTDLLHRVVFEEMNNLRQFYEAIDMACAGPDRGAASGQSGRLCDRLPGFLYVCLLSGLVADQGPRGVHILKGSDSTAIDWLTNAPDHSLVTIITTSRYPNELIKLGKVARRLQTPPAGDHRQRLCPVIPFAHLSLVVPSRSIPLIGYPTTISCIINYLVLELVNRQHPQLKAHQERLEQMYLENDILFNMHGHD
jgi:hypothetical protein